MRHDCRIYVFPYPNTKPEEHMQKEKPRKRRYEVPRGTGVQVAARLKLAPSHVTRVIKGQREGGPTLVAELEAIEANARADYGRKP